ncbi:hypothetical protein PS708_00604 [Pseudomonas fluorescens]|nr:hypothetical protein PS708_00604 [Pseudomonas fluorescens]
MKQIRVLAFSEFPGPRRESIGPNSGEKFRDTVLLPAIKENPNEIIVVDLDGTAGYGSSFLEEAFGGLLRNNVPYTKAIELCNHIISEDDESLIEEIREYIDDEQKRQEHLNK